MTRKIEEYELTAFALGELDEERAKEIAAELQVNETARRFVEEILETSVLLGHELKKEPAVELDEPRVAAIRVPKKRRWVRRTALIVAPMAAALGFMFLLQSQYQSAEVHLIKESSELIIVEAPPVQSAPVTTDAPANGYRSPYSWKFGEADRPVVTSPPSNNEVAGMKKPSLAHVYAQPNEPLDTGLPASRHSRVVENAFLGVREHPLSTFSIDVDTASYAILRRYLQQDQMPPKDAVRIEEMINYFDYDLPEPTDDPIAVHVDVTDAPWHSDHLLARVALKAREVSTETRPPANLVFLVDVSGSMAPPDRLPLLIQGLEMLAESLRGDDRVAIVVYAGAAGVVLPSTEGDRKGEILQALRRLSSGGSTNGGAGIHLAYELAREHFIDGGINRVILATDGDFNVGTTSNDALVELIRDRAKSGVFLTVLGFGIGNYNDAALEQLADKGNGNYAYIDNAAEAKRVLVDQVAGTLHTVAKNVKIQLEMNPERVSSYRLIGYENRALRAEEFEDDRVDAGEIGAGHTVTALYELVPVADRWSIYDGLKYQDRLPTPASLSGEIFTIKLRYQDPDGAESRMIERAVHESKGHLNGASADLKFAAAVAGFGMLLRDSPHKTDLTYDRVRELAEAGRGPDPDGHRTELVSLILAAERIETSDPNGAWISADEIASILGANRISVAPCYQVALRAKERLVGRLDVVLKLNSQGEVISAHVEPAEYRGTRLGDCLIKTIKKWPFPSSAGAEMRARLPFMLETSGSATK